MTTKTNVTPTNKANEFAVRSMFGKAVCAYANWDSVKTDEDQLRMLYGDIEVEKSLAAHMSEYEATVRCLEMLVDEHLPEVCMIVIAEARKMMGE